MAASEERTLPSPSPSPIAPPALAIPKQAQTGSTAAMHPGLDHFNAAPPDEARAFLLDCCASERWAQRVAEHRPYPDLDALLAAADEAGYDLGPADLDEALAAEESEYAGSGDTPQSALTALRAAHAAYEAKFGHAFLLSLDAFHDDEHLDQVLAGLRTRLTNDPDEERSVAAEQLRRLARERITDALYVLTYA
ncbi:2-oxo-4-hydroxy-4-carboxy-5-ureidoimidazoline decarboxylase [Streptomyces sp. TRM66268-LWL]|uniref:2-oxo-4-hydroxy-4-carboxy-5-ureidoimidazoline decarboxylase n=1 Tax=Streptomyces polyasparticus TaxID=2767826 RepID=A0ABR7SS89_9ACTN|nr:2-oxo-4-hydroxy-4-carboxy-5-ureidoimidazoline decarboxylase [Streptomyces polyasparticus]MBC9717173.1 2-oxo-4-hydroxy-4-carboxy-5-ureidoimidazoline decarboxylase [Streptomyces polyasparticus]